MAETKYKIINDMILQRAWLRNVDDLAEYAILLHPSIIRKFKKMWHQNVSKLDDWKIFEYTLEIGSLQCYDMFLVIISLETPNLYLTIRDAVLDSQFLFPWEEKLTLFISVELFNVMEEFIRINNLQAYILKIEEKPGITWNDGIIKVVTFNTSVNTLKIIPLYRNHLIFTGSYQSDYYYMTHAFPWQQARWRQHFEIPIPDKCYSVFPIIVHNLKSLNYNNELNIFDLLSIRLAFCDDRNPSPSHLLKFDIDFMIKRELAKIVKDNHLDLDQYLLAKNYEQRELLIGYLIYEFQHHFETVKTLKIIPFPKLTPLKICRYIKLVRERDVLKIIKQKSNINFDIDGSRYDRMSLSLFLDLIECHNVVKITLDTNYRWINDECSLNRSVPNLEAVKHVKLIGTDIYNFVEEFISSLQTVIFRKRQFGKIRLEINCNVNDLRIFDNLTFTNSFPSTFKNTRLDWALLNNFNEFDVVEIHENEDTWQSLYEFALSEIDKSNSNEFHFNHSRYTIISGYSEICLGQITFTVDELKSKLEIRDTNTNEIIDLFVDRFWMQPGHITFNSIMFNPSKYFGSDDKTNYDFYQ